MGTYLLLLSTFFRGDDEAMDGENGAFDSIRSGGKVARVGSRLSQETWRNTV